jgi:hypothetical protein
MGCGSKWVGAEDRLVLDDADAVDLFTGKRMREP